MRGMRTRAPGNFGLGLPGWKAAMVLAAIGLGSCACASALDPSLDISQYAHTAWKVRDGYFKGEVHAIAQTPDGYLWIGTGVGLVRFDGVRAVPWQPPGGAQLPSSYIRDLVVGRDGTLWISTLKGLASWRDGKLTQYPEVAGQIVSALLEDHEGTIWFGIYEPGRICSVHSGKVQCYGAGSFGLGVYCIYEDRNGNLWATAQTGLWRWKPGPPEQVKFPRGEIGALIEDERGTLLLATNVGFKQLAGGRIQDYNLPGISGAFRPTSFLRSSDGSLWVGTHQGLIHVHDGRIDMFGLADGLSGDPIWSMFEDREGDIWVGTSDGLDRFREYAFPRVGTDQGLSSSDAHSVQAATDGAIWIATPNGLDQWENGNITVYGRRSLNERGPKRESELTGDAAVRQASNSGFADAPGSLGLDDRGRLWASSNDGVFVLKDNRFVRIPGLHGAYVWSIVADAQGNVWISDGTAGLFFLPYGGPVQSIPWSRLGRTGFGARALVPDASQGGVWLGFYEGGITYFKDGQVRASYSSADGLGRGHVNQLRFGSRGALWAATEGGLSRIKDGHIETLTRKNGLPCDEVHWSMEDDDHAMWLYMPCGLARIDPSEWYAWANNPTHVIKTMVFDASDGVMAVVFLGGYGPRMTKAPDGKIWFSNVDGVSVINPHRLPFNKVPPPVYVEQVTADDKTYDASAGLRLPPHVHYLTIDYTALSLVAPEKMHFRYKLDGVDRGWREVVNDRRVQYSNLGPGSYHFRVIASNNSGVWNETGASLDFSIAPAYYQTTWFRILCVAAFLGLLWALYLLRLQQVRRQFAAGLEGRVSERMRIARELHDTLLQSFQGLMLQIQAASNMLPRKPEKAKDALDKALLATEQAIAEGRDAIHDLRPEVAAQRDLPELLNATGRELAAAQEDNGHSSAFLVTVEGKPHTLSAMLQDEIYRIAREAIRNAFRHAHASRIEVEIHYDAQQLRLRIRDDGRGIDSKVLETSGRPGHWGIPGIRERAQRIGSRLEFWSEAGAGTEVELTVPAAIAYGKQRDGHRLRIFRGAGNDG